MTRSPKILIPALLAVVAVAGFYFMVLSPQREQAAQLDTDIAAKQAEARRVALPGPVLHQGPGELQDELHDADQARQGRHGR